LLSSTVSKKDLNKCQTKKRSKYNHDLELEANHLNTKEDAINLHRILKGKIEIHNRISVENAFDEEKGTLGLIYTPGVAYVATEISNNKELVYDYTSKWNNVAIICDGTRVLGLRALLDMRAKGLDEDMLVTASYAIASLVEKPHLKEDYIIPKVNDPRILPIVTKTLKDAIKSHMSRTDVS